MLSYVLCFKKIYIGGFFRYNMAKKGESIEENIGIKWFARIGILALIIGIGYFIKYAIDRNWINHLTRILIGLVVGLFLVIIGEIVSKKENYMTWARTLEGGGIVIMYFSAYAAYHFEAYRNAIGITLMWDIILLSIIILAGIFLSLKDNSKIIAAEAFFLGFITSLLSSSFGTLTLVYNLLLAIGLVSVVIYKKWLVLGIGGVIATYLFYIPWVVENPNQFWMAISFLISYFLIFNIQALFSRSEKNEGLNIAVVLINSALFFLFSYFQIYQNYFDFRGFYVFILALVYFFLYLIAQSIDKKEISLTNLAIGILFLTLAIPIQLNKDLITIVWGLETLLLTFIGIKLDNKTIRISSYVVGILTFAKIIQFDTWMLQSFSWNDILGSTRLISFLVGIVVFLICAYLLNQDKGSKEYKGFRIFYIVAAVVSTFLIIGLEAKDQYITILWGVLFLGLIIRQILEEKSLVTEILSYIIGGILFLKLLLRDSFMLKTAEYLFMSPRFLTYLTIIAIFYLSAILLVLKDKKFGSICSWLASFLVVVLLGIEIEGYLLSVSWAIFGLVLMVLGFMVARPQVRIQAISVLLLAVAKAFLVDVWELETIYRVVSFIVLGVILLLASFLYSKFRDKIKKIVAD